MDNESDEDQFPVLTCDIVFCSSLRHLQVVDSKKAGRFAPACRQSRNAACELIWRQIHPPKESCIQSLKNMFDGSRERIPI
jgi:hypothetical protein